MNKGALKGSTPDKAVARWKNIASTRTKVNDLDTDIKDTKDAIDFMLKAYDRATSSDETLHAELLKLRSQALGLTQQFGGSKARSEVGEKSEYPTINYYMWKASGFGSSYGPTKTNLECLDNVNTLYNDMTAKLKGIKDSMLPLEGKLEKIGAPKIKK